MTFGGNITTLVMGLGWINMNMTSRKIVALHDLLYMPDVSGNIVSSSLLDQKGYKVILDFNKIIIQKNYLLKKYIFVMACSNLT